MKRRFYLIVILIASIQVAFGQQYAPMVSPTAGPQQNKVYSTVNAYERNGRKADSTSLDPLLRPFYHGVASGDPLQDRVIIWTRVTPEGEETSIDVDWVVATDTSLNNVVQSGMTTTTAARDFTVKVDVEGLSPATTYYYEFTANDRKSLIGRTRTAPSGDEVDQLKLAVVSCSNYEAGYFSAYGRIADRNDLDAVVHLGDYFYEYPTGVYGDSTLINQGERIHQNFETVELDQYRARYSLYRMDKDLRRVHQQHPFVAVWDDHESANDAYRDGAENHTDSTEGDWNVRKAISRQVYYEWMPIRESEVLYRTLKYGDLMDLIMLDTRIEGRDIQINNILDPALYAPDRTILGETQRNWFLEQLSSSTAKWKVIGDQVIFSELHLGWFAFLDPTDTNQVQTFLGIEGLFTDIWDGYPIERLGIMNYIRANNIDDVIFLAGDFHSTFAFDVVDTATVVDLTAVPPVLYAPSDNYNPETGEGSIAVEFVTPSISSANFDENLDVQSAGAAEAAINTNFLSIVAPGVGNPNPHMKFTDLDRHGYFLLDLKADSAQADWYFINSLFEQDSEANFEQGQYTKAGDNHLTTSAAPSNPKAVQEIAAPAAPNNVATSVAEDVAQFAILGVYPNPASGLARMQYAIDKRMPVRIQLRDLQGRIVSTLVNADQAAGVYDVVIETSTLASGMYQLSIQVGEAFASRKLLVNP